MPGAREAAGDQGLGPGRPETPRDVGAGPRSSHHGPGAETRVPTASGRSAAQCLDGLPNRRLQPPKARPRIAANEEFSSAAPLRLKRRTLASTPYQMPTPSSLLERLHTHCIHNRPALAGSQAAGCFHCLASFAPSAITEWVDDDDTALCPHCGIDSVIPSDPTIPLSPTLLQAMHSYWFERTVRVRSKSTLWQRLRWRLEPLLRRWAWFRLGR